MHFERVAAMEAAGGLASRDRRKTAGEKSRPGKIYRGTLAPSHAAASESLPRDTCGPS